MGLEPRARCAGFSVAEIGNRKERLRDYASFPGFLPLNPLRTPSPPLKRAGTPCTRERGLRLGLTALRGASEGWVTSVNSLFCSFNPPRSEERVQGTKFLAGVWGLESRARCAGFSVTEIGNRKERLRVREAGASAAGRGQRPHASFPDQSPIPLPPSSNRREAKMGV